MTAVATPDAARLVFAAVAGLILLLILIIKFKVHAMISILIGAVGIGLMAGMPLSDIIGSVNEGIGNTLKGIALLVGLGSMFGAILEESGGAQTLAVTMVRKFGDEKAAWALGITGLVGAGRSEVLQAVFGADKRQSGDITIEGQPCKIHHPADAIAKGLALVPEGRKAQSLFLQFTVKENITIVSMKQVLNKL